MGDEIADVRFSAGDFARFAARLRGETALARDALRSGHFAERGFSIGFEIEAWLLDHAGHPHPVNEQFLAVLGDPLVVPELSRFNVEFNCTPQALGDFALRRAEMELAELWARSNHVAHGLDSNLVMIGTLPTIRNGDLSLDNHSPLKRYHALNREVLRRRGGAPIRIDIDGDEPLRAEHADVMLEAATTSFQTHLAVPASLAHRYWNASAIASGPVLAACGNAPFLFGHSLWEETRIPLFEQAVGIAPGDRGQPRVTFGRDYYRGSIDGWLTENRDDYPVLLPVLFDASPDRLHHARLHNGTIWRWNRPLIGFDPDGVAHLRIEHRILPAGPSFVDMLANAALYFGLVGHIVSRGIDLDEAVDFASARANFYAAARSGLAADLSWVGGREVRASSLLVEELLPAARAGLADFGVAAEDQARYLDTIEARVRTGLTGAVWQRACLEACRGDRYALMAAYCERQRSGEPVHCWDVPAHG